MTRLFSLVAVVLMTAVVIGLRGCGGGGGSVPYVNSPQPQTPAPAPPAQPNPPEITGVSPSSAVEGQSVTFTASTSGGAATSWSWDFGGGATPNTSTAASPTVTIGTTGSYDASVTATNDDGSDTFSFTLTVNPSGAPPTSPGTISTVPLGEGTWHVEELPPLPPGPEWLLESPCFNLDGMLSGVYWLSFGGEYPNEKHALMMASFVNGTWQAEKATPEGSHPYYPSLAFDSGGRPGLTWSTRTDTSVHFARNSNGVWEDQLVAPGGFFAATTQLAFDSQDRAVIAFDYLHDIPGPNYERPLKVAREVGDGWEITDVEGEGDGSIVVSFSLAIDSQDRAVVAYGAKRQLRVAIVDGSSVEIQHVWVRDGDSGYAVGGPSLALRPDGRAVIFFGESTRANFHRFLVARETDGGWEFDEIGTHRGNARERYLVITQDGIPILKNTVVISEDPYTEQSYWGWYVNDSWHIEELPPEVRGKLMLHPDGYPVIGGGKRIWSYQ